MVRGLFLIFLCIIKLSIQQEDEDSTTSVIFEDPFEKCETTYQTCQVIIKNSGPPSETAASSTLGSKGEKGERGDPGLTGANGRCDCKKSYVTKAEFISGLPGNIKITKDGETCIVHKKNITETAVLDEKQCLYEGKLRKFWYSECRHNLREIYEIPEKDLRYIAENFDTVTQTFRYHCKRSFNLRNNTEYYLRLLSWNNVIICFKPSDTSPFTYYIPEEFDKCKDEKGAHKDEWKNSIIKVSSNLNLMLPLIDFQIRDIQPGQNQSFFIEPVELCFK